MKVDRLLHLTAGGPRSGTPWPLLKASSNSALAKSLCGQQCFGVYLPAAYGAQCSREVRKFAGGKRRSMVNSNLTSWSTSASLYRRHRIMSTEGPLTRWRGS